ncbi:putative molybdenum carrier protein [Ruegeria atlantica]|uniref:putative molybdenum carrier protein n=1 Tax=Ruegeria atlantica TaxID=81569 RepID=UPI00147EBBA1
MKIITGGQTGVDLAAWQFALENDIPYGGWVPKGRLNEAGRIPDRFTGLTETQSEDVAERTRLNVLSCDALLVFLDGSSSPGTQLTIDFAHKTGKPCLVVDLRQQAEICVREVKPWIMARPNAVLNVAGPRESEAPQIGAKVTAVLRQSVLPNSTDK